MFIIFTQEDITVNTHGDMPTRKETCQHTRRHVNTQGGDMLTRKKTCQQARRRVNTQENMPTPVKTQEDMPTGVNTQGDMSTGKEDISRNMLMVSFITKHHKTFNNTYFWCFPCQKFLRIFSFKLLLG